jgi:hypothetical protein
LGLGSTVDADRPLLRTPEVNPHTEQRLSEFRAALPDDRAMRRWLLSEAIVSAEGAVFSWSNPQRPGYAYPEAAGLLLSTIAAASFSDADAAAVADRVAGCLVQSIAADGGVGRGGITYLFDATVVLAGLLRYRAAGGRIGGDEPIHRLWRFAGDRIASAAAVKPAAASSDGRWSTQFGAHLVKSLYALHLYEGTFGKRLPEHLVAALINRSGQQPSPVYIHPFCYEQEGHVLVARNDLPSVFEPVAGPLDWLAALQQPDGAILAFANGMEGFGEARSDATAQAVRLWLLEDRTRYAEPIARGLAFLACCQSPDGGIRYAPGSGDLCSWSTMFTLQAVDWFLRGPRPDELL